MDRAEAEDYVYRSYLNAEKHWDRDSRDSVKRHPEYSKGILESMSHTPSVVVTGSKGKGSVSMMISVILSTEFRVGLMTSPHILSFNERFRIGDEAISDMDLISHTERIKGLFDPIESTIPEGTCISPMGIQSAIALSYFNENGTDIDIFECGKGAKNDDVNNIPHRYSVINTIFLEHTRELGGTLEEIAEDKSHVITGGEECVYVAEQDEAVMDILRKRADGLDVRMKVYGRDFRSDNIRYTQEGMMFDVHVGDISIADVTIPLLGGHQARNCALAMAICSDILKKMDHDRIRSALSGISWPGRFEMICARPIVILDACINTRSCEEVIPIIDEMGIDGPNVIIGIPDDKDFIGVSKTIAPVSNRITMTRSDNPHYFFSPSQTEYLRDEGIEAEWSDSLEKAIGDSFDGDRCILILGTTSVVSQVKRMQSDGTLTRIFDGCGER